MQTITQDHSFTHTTSRHVESRSALRMGRALSALAVLFLLVDSVGKLLELQPVIDGTTQLGYPASAVFRLGVVELLCVVVYLIPRTSVLGAVLLTGYLGGAIATHVRVENPLFSHTLFPTYVAWFVWGGLFLRDARLHGFLPWRARS
jgi:DoxX-like family